jgi:hypothetical protein
MRFTGKVVAAGLSIALASSAFAASAAHADAPKSGWKAITRDGSHAIAVAIGLVPDASSPVNCTKSLVFRGDKRVALTWVTEWGAKPERNGACGDRKPLAGDDAGHTSGYLSLQNAEGNFTVVTDMAAPECTPLERALVDAGLDVKAIIEVMSQVVNLSPLEKCKLTIVDDQTPWRAGSTAKMRAVARDVGAAPIKNFPDRCYSVSLLRVDPRVAVLRKTTWGNDPAQYEKCGYWEWFAAPIAVWDGTRWKQVSDTYTSECSALRATLASYGVPQAGIDEVLSITLGGTTGNCS